jgi:AraC-like DNA-binding protein
MGRRVPIFTNQDEVYQADTCQPLIRAVQAGEIRLETLVHGHYPGRALPRNALPGLKTVGFWDADEPQAWGLDWHQNEGLELTLLERGTLDFAVEGQACRLKPHDLTVTRPWQRHRLGGPRIEPGRLHWLILDLGVRRPHQAWRWPPWIMLADEDLRELTRILRHNEQPVWHNATQVCECFARIAQVIEGDDHGSSVSWLTVLLNELLLHTLALFRSRDVSLDERLSDTERTVELFLDDLRSDRGHLAEEWTVRRMAEACSLGVTRFTDYCRRLTNTTPMQHLNRLRLESAAQLLSEPQQLSNAALAEICGFSSARYFATVFRRHFGCTPQQYRLRKNAAAVPS